MRENAPVMDRLRDATREQHLQIEALPFFRAIMAGDLLLVSYVGLLRALSVMYEVFEQAIAHVQHPQVVAVWDSSMRKLPLIDRDLAYFQRYRLPQTPVAVLRAHLLTQTIRRHAHDDSVSLLGYLYVLEGSTLGSLILQQHLASIFQLSESDGLAYVSGYGKATKVRWNAFKQRMNKALVDSMEQDHVIVAAVEMFTGIGRITEALYPLDAPAPLQLVRELNPAAGTHGIPSDDRELQAALRAGERSWQQFPYYKWRYGERGAQYTRSDSAWLVTLVPHEQPVVDQQIRWLGRLLAARGMPRWMLELHLDVLYEELVAAVPARHDTYVRLQRAAQGLREERRRAISDQVIAAYSVAFDQQVGSEWSTQLPKTGALLAAAVADEQSGIVQAVTSIEGWMTDSDRFPSRWVEAVQQTIHLARAQAMVAEPGI